MIKVVKGDLLDMKRGILGHQVNCQGVMGSGVALQIKNMYPLAFTEYKSLVDEYVEEGEEWRKYLLGQVNGVKVSDDLYIANMFGQLRYGSDGGKYTSEEALFRCFKTVRKTAEKLDLPVYLPYMIGGYRGGGDWRLIEDYLLEAFDGYDVTLMKLHRG
jgi:O-acetyl-ADP-ribose deacetylase (regulator of RNase III)